MAKCEHLLGEINGVIRIPNPSEMLKSRCIVEIEYWNITADGRAVRGKSTNRMKGDTNDADTDEHRNKEHS